MAKNFLTTYVDAVGRERRLVSLIDSAVPNLFTDSTIITRAVVENVTIESCFRCTLQTNDYFNFISGTVNGAFDLATQCNTVLTQNVSWSRYTAAGCAAAVETTGVATSPSANMQTALEFNRPSAAPGETGKKYFVFFMSSIAFSSPRPFTFFHAVIDPCDFIEGNPIPNGITAAGCFQFPWNPQVDRIVAGHGGTVTFYRICP
jgi:hypothetical protein